MRFAHTNLVANDYRRLAAFYEAVFGCEAVPPPRSLAAPWLAKGTGVPEARLEGVHLRVPGHGLRGPTLEIFTYQQMLPAADPQVPNRCGFGHIAFEVDDVAAVMRSVEQHGGKALGEIVSAEVPDAGMLTFVYVTDPEGNIIELQSWT